MIEDDGWKKKNIGRTFKSYNGTRLRVSGSEGILVFRIQGDESWSYFALESEDRAELIKFLQEGVK